MRECRASPGGLLRRNRTAASENAHSRCALPIFLPEHPCGLPSEDAWHFTSRL